VIFSINYRCSNSVLQ